MKFLLYAKVDHLTIEERLGTPDYSYFFLLRAFSAVLAQLGEVVQVKDPEQADLIHAQCVIDGERCLLLSFAPPHKTPVGLVCPTIPVFAWEYPDIPERIEESCWQDDPRHDWRHVLARTGRAITLSTHTVDAVKRSMGQDYPIVAIPSPLSVAPNDYRQSRVPPAPDGTLFKVHASVADSARMGLDPNGLICLDEEDGTAYDSSDDAALPEAVTSGDGNAAAIPAPVQPNEPCEPGESEPAICGWGLPSVALIRTRLRGVVYTSVLTPSAGRKNWEDLLTAFCWAFRDTADATLVLKLAGTELEFHHHQLLMLLSKLSPFQCRVIAINGYVSDEDYAALVDATTYYVNASLCEGLCLPLMEFLSAGVPALAPDNTAMADYIRDDLAFVVASYPGMPKPWPHGDNETHRTSCHQLDWQSLMEAYRQSYQVAMHDPGRYLRMSRRAGEAMQAYCGVDVVKSQLHAFLCPWLAPLELSETSTSDASLHPARVAP